MSKNNIVVSLIIMALTGCMNISAPTSVPASETPWIKNTIVSTPTILPVASPSVTPDPRYVNNCVQVDDQPVSLSNVTLGTILLYTASPDYKPFLMDIQTGQKYFLPFRANSYFLGAVSPDRNLLAYFEGVIDSQYQVVESILWVVNAHGDVQSKTTFVGSLGNNLRWLGNDRVIFYTDQTSVDGTVMMVNPFTGEHHLISNELPNLLIGYVSWDVSWRVEYSPNLEWTAYLGSTEHSWGGSPIIRDVTTGKTIWQVESEWNWDMPVWSPDGSQVAVIVWNEQAAQSELYLIDRSGQAKPVFVKGQRLASALSWSPDGKRIAFWNDAELMIYDKDSDQVVNLCVRNDITTPSAPVWSPDSMQLGATQYVEENLIPVETYAVLIKLEHGIAYRVPEMPKDVFSDVWMNSIP